MIKAIAITLILLSLIGCGDIGDELECVIDQSCTDYNTPVPTPTVGVPAPQATPTKIPPKVTPKPTVPAAGSNPVCSGVQDSRQHLLHKPRSDNRPEAVLVFDGKYKREFLSVKIELKNGTYSEGYWKPLELYGNPDSVGPRQHWRLKVTCDKIKDKALIVVDDTMQECRFRLPGDPCKRHE